MYLYLKQFLILDLIGRDSANHASRSELYKNGDFPIIHLINNDGLRIMLANKKHPYQNTSKVIINGLGVPYVLDDTAGKYGVTQLGIYVLEPSKKEKIFLFSKLFQYLNWAYRIQGNNNDLFLFEILPDLNEFDFSDEVSMFRELSLNKEDIKEINKFKVPVFPLVEKIEKVGEGKAPRAKTAKASKAKGGSMKPHRFTRRKSRN